MDDNWQDHVEDVMTAPNSLEKARAEQRLARAMPKAGWSEKRKEICRLTGESPKNMDCRLRLLRASPASDHLWPEIDHGSMTFQDAVDEIRRLEALSSVEKAPASPPLPPPSVAPPPGPVQDMPEEPKAPRRDRTKPPGTAKRRMRPDMVAHISEHVTKLMGRAEKALRKRNPLLPDGDVRHLMKQFEEDVRSSARIIVVRADRMEKAVTVGAAEDLERRSRAVSDMLLKSCRILKVDRPKNGDPVDIVMARSNMRRIAGSLHPDRNPGNDELYREVIDAFTDLERYNEGLGG